MNRITHFEIYTDDPQAVQPFYQDVFGWKFNRFDGGPIEYWLVTTGDDKEPGINGGMTRPREGQSPGTLNTVAVKSIDQTIKRIEQRGGKICVPKMVIPKVCWLCYAEDSAGNVFGIIEPDEKANNLNRKKFMTTKTEAAKALVLERTYHAPVARVWKALTDVD